MRKLLIALVGPSKCGKSSLIAKMLERHPGILTYCTSITTRDPRPDDQPGEFRHVSRAEFEKLLEDGKLIQHVRHDGNIYGDERTVSEAIFAAGKIAIRPLVEQSIAAFRAEGIQVFTVSVTPTGSAYSSRSPERAAEDAERKVSAYRGDLPLENEFDMAGKGFENCANQLSVAICTLADMTKVS